MGCAERREAHRSRVALERDGICYPVTHVLPMVAQIAYAETVRTGQHTPSGVSIANQLMSYDVVCFDCDSTLSRIEGIDELAKVAGVGEAMAKLTNAAMNGEVPLEAVYGQRLDIIQPNRQSIDWLANLYVKEMVTGVQDVFGRLFQRITVACLHQTRLVGRIALKTHCLNPPTR